MISSGTPGPRPIKRLIPVRFPRGTLTFSVRFSVALMWRVNGQMPHIDAWYEAFGITEDDPMFVPKEKRVTIW